MLVERGMRVMNAEVVGDAYAIAANYLRRAGAIPDNLVTNDWLLAIIVQIFRSGETNTLRLANRAIAKFQASRFEALRFEASGFEASKLEATNFEAPEIA